jgi:transcriptional regulator with XRE-family HTH domain
MNIMSERFMDLLNKIDPRAVTSGQVLRALRKGLELTLKDVEDITGLKEQNLSALENDRMEMTVHYAGILAAALGVHPTDILFPNGKWEKSDQISAIERKARKFIGKKRAV